MSAITLDSSPTSLRLFAFVAGPLFVLYLATATWTYPYGADQLTNVLAAEELAQHGDVFLDRHEVLATPEFEGAAAWVVPAGDSAATQYPPGVALLAAPVYRIWPHDSAVGPFVSRAGNTVELPRPPLFPAALVAAGATATAVGLLGLAFRRLSEARTALAGAYVAGLATGAWSVASDSLWQHGPAMLWIAAGMVLSVDHRFWSGLGFGAAILTRPHTAVVAAGNGLWQSMHKRALTPMVQIGIGSILGLVAVVGYNRFVFGAASISGGYGGAFGERVASLNLLSYARNVVMALVDPSRGLLVYSPFLLFLIPGLRAAWRAGPAWVRGSAIGGLVYLLIQLKANRFSGGDGFWGYRYPLETLTAAAPLLFLSYTEWVHHRQGAMRRWFRYVVGLSILLTLCGAAYFSNFWASPLG